MSAAKHTPAPWQWETVEQKGAVTVHTLKGPDVLCRYWYDNPPSCDARLIATAPELLTALKALVAINEAWNVDVQNMIGLTPNWNASYLDVAKAAIQKAEGAQ